LLNNKYNKDVILTVRSAGITYHFLCLASVLCHIMNMKITASNLAFTSTL